jgi:ketosteroid isomerase-like protein
MARRYFSLLAQGDFDAVLELVHPEIQLTLKTTRPGETLHGREEVAGFLAEMADGFYESAAEVFTPLDEDRIVVEGRIRWVDEERVLRDDPMVWALSVRDGLLVRSSPAQTPLEAESILAVPTGDEDELSPV